MTALILSTYLHAFGLVVAPCAFGVIVGSSFIYLVIDMLGEGARTS